PHRYNLPRRSRVCHRSFTFDPSGRRVGWRMHSTARLASVVGMALFVAVAATGSAQRTALTPSQTSTAQGDAPRKVVTAAQALLSTLDGSGRSKVQFPFDGPQKTRWSNLPSGAFQREGLRLGDLTQPQRDAVTALLSVALSRDGFRKVGDIMRGDEVL